MAKKKGLGSGLASLIPQSQHVQPQGMDVLLPPRKDDKHKTATDQERKTEIKDEKIHDLLNPTGNSRIVKAVESARSKNKNEVTKKVESKEKDPDTSQMEEGLLPVPGTLFAKIPLEMIKTNSRQPREYFDEDELEELSASIKEVGVLQPVVVRPLPIEKNKAAKNETTRDEKKQYELIMGERRLRATQMAGIQTIPAIIRQTEDQDLLRDALLENLHRVALNPLEEAAAYQQLLDDFDCTQEELAKKISRSRPQIANTLRLLKLPGSVQTHVAASTISAGHARALLSLNSKEAMEKMAQRIIAEGLSVRSTEEIIAIGEGEDSSFIKPVRSKMKSSESELHYAEEISSRLDTRVKVKIGRSKGSITIDFAGEEDLNRIISLINRP